ncbi:DinB family protein [Paenibacillus sp. NFR01]|uniref:DinB family protein n=1 Tax=Paenibacillus sp. NFR01 TaxID=1566279 RepID=UPI0008C3B3B9|nr:DinB family protein [Paenibacillus sp. NFR01]SET49298.1 Uncharacterized damage-inducible protein DinB (forms a four-helix bundle) [Paenibacillus sp. NFR01]
MSYPAEMYRYHDWANQTLLNRIQELPVSVLGQEVNSSFPTLAHALSHIYAVDKLWYMVLTGTGMPEALQATYPLNGQIVPTVEEYRRRFAELAGEFEVWFREPRDLEQTIVLNNPYAGVRNTRLAEIVLHLVNHGTYHRGNVSTMLRQLGHASTMTDYIFYLYQAGEAQFPQHEVR